MATYQDPLFSVAGQSVLVAGGIGGLGLPIARMLGERGASVAIADIDAEGAQAAARSLAAAGIRTMALALDVTSPASCAAAVEQMGEAWGRLDGMVNAAGIYRIAPALNLAEQAWRDSIDVNLSGAYYLARAAGAAMLRQGAGSIVSIASVSSLVANRNYAAYAASKAGIAHVTRVLALEWATTGVRVNALGPALTATPMVAEVMDDPPARAAALGKIPMGRFGTAEDLFGAVVFLLAAASRFVTGQVMYVDGGRTIA